MEKSVMAFLSDGGKNKSNFASVVSQMVGLIGEYGGDLEGMKSVDMRLVVTEMLASMLQSVSPDREAWPMVKHEMTYDQYIENRRAKGTLTPYDLVRRGLAETQFSTAEKYFEHYMRVHAEKARMESAGGLTMKRCTKCGEVKPSDKFKRGGICNACRARAYRASVAKRLQGEQE